MINVILNIVVLLATLLPSGTQGGEAADISPISPAHVTPCLAASDKCCYHVTAFSKNPQIVISGPIKNSSLIAERLYIHYEWSKLLQISSVREDGEITPIDTIQLRRDRWTVEGRNLEPKIAYFGHHGATNDRLLAVYEYPSVKPDFQMRLMPQVCKIYNGDTLEYRIEPRFETIKRDQRAAETLQSMTLKCQGDYLVWIALISVEPFRKTDKVVFLSIFHKQDLTDLCIAHFGDESLQAFKEFHALRTKDFEVIPSHEGLTVSVSHGKEILRTFTIREWIKVASKD